MPMSPGWPGSISPANEGGPIPGNCANRPAERGVAMTRVVIGTERGRDKNRRIRFDQEGTRFLLIALGLDLYDNINVKLFL